MKTITELCHFQADPFEVSFGTEVTFSSKTKGSQPLGALEAQSKTFLFHILLCSWYSSGHKRIQRAPNLHDVPVKINGKYVALVFTLLLFHQAIKHQLLQNWPQISIRKNNTLRVLFFH